MTGINEFPQCWNCWNCLHYGDTSEEGGPCNGCGYPGWINYADIRKELARLTAERDTLAQAVHILRAGAGKMCTELRALRAQRQQVVSAGYGVIVNSYLDHGRHSVDGAAWTKLVDAIVAVTTAPQPPREVERHEADLAQQALDDLRSAVAERDALRAELDALKGQEPAAQVLLLPERVGFGRIEERKRVKLLVDVPVGAALYTAPQPPREVERLTDQQIDVIEEGFSNEFGLEAKYSRDFARAVENAMAEKAGFVLKEPK